MNKWISVIQFNSAKAKKIAVFSLLGITLIGATEVLPLHSDRTSAAVSSSSQSQTNPVYLEQQQRFSEVMQLLSEQELNKKQTVSEMTDKAIEAMVQNTGDPYAKFIPKTEVNTFLDNMKDTYSGVGILFDQEGNTFPIQSVKLDSPASKAGIYKGDQITAINGIAVHGKTVEQLGALLRGNAGTQLTVDVSRKGSAIRFALVRTEVTNSSVESHKIEYSNIAYIKINSFSKGTAQDFYNQFTALQKLGCKGLILDLRNNMGGFVDESQRVAENFIDKGTYYLTVDGQSHKDTISITNGRAWNNPIVILVNSNTASAAEILTAALKDNKKAMVIGTRTYGKGVIQNMKMLRDGDILKYTTKEYLSPTSKKINGIGINPDQSISNDSAQLDAATNWLQKLVKTS